VITYFSTFLSIMTKHVEETLTNKNLLFQISRWYWRKY